MWRIPLVALLFAVTFNGSSASSEPSAFIIDQSAPPPASCPLGWNCDVTLSGSGFVQRQETPENATYFTQLVVCSWQGEIGAWTSIGISGFPPVKRGPYAYLVNRDGNTISVVDYSDLSAVKAESLDVGQSPQGIAISPSGGYLYVATGDGKILVIRAHDRHRVSEISLTAKPVDLVISRDGSHLYAVTEGGKSIIVIDTAARSVVKTITLDHVSDRLVIHPDGKRLYSLSHGGGTVHVIDAVTGAVGSKYPLMEKGIPQDIALDAFGERLYITLGHSATASTSLAVLDTTTNAISFPDISFSGLPRSLVVHPVAQQLFVTTEPPQASSCGVFGNIHVVDTSNLTLMAAREIRGVIDNGVVDKSGWFFGVNKQTNSLELRDTRGSFVTSDYFLSQFPVAGLGPLVVGPELASMMAPSAQLLDFGEAPSGQAVAHSLTITNTGGLPLTVYGAWIEASGEATSSSAATSPSGFRIVEDSCKNKILQPDEKCVITLSYSPAASGQSNALVYIENDSTILNTPVAVTARGVSSRTADAQPSSADSGGGGGSWSPVSLMVVALAVLLRSKRRWDGGPG